MLTPLWSFVVRPKSLQYAAASPNGADGAEADFFTKQARLQIEARMALAQAKDMAHMQMEVGIIVIKRCNMDTDA